MSRRIAIVSVETLSKRWADLKRYVIDYRRRDGRVERLVREVHDHGSGAAVLPYDHARGTVLLVRQFRLPVHLSGADGDIVEACAGLLDGDPPADCAAREAEEELGYRVHNLREVASCFMTPGAVTEHLTLFLADYGMGDRIGEGGGVTHEGEDVEVIETPAGEAFGMVERRAINDAKTVMLLLFLERDLKARRSLRSS
jgi:GDP-mannose pyrophosphatase NudK